MGIGGINIWSLLIILAIIVLLFGTKKLKGIGGDLGSAVKGFKKAIGDDEKQADEKSVEDKSTDDAAVTEEKEKAESK